MKTTVKIGRDNTNDVIINLPGVSRNHAIITDLGNSTYEVKDLSSANGTFVNGEKISQQVIHADDILKVAGSIVDWQIAFKASPAWQAPSVIREEPFAKIRKTITAGSSENGDLVITDEYVSNHHAKISLLANGDYYLQDLGSSNGSFVNGTRVTTKNFSKTDIVKLGKSDLPANWFQHQSLQIRFYKEHRKAITISVVTILLITASALAYFNRCSWFSIDCALSAKEIYSRNKNTLVHIEHEYYYTIQFNGVKYYVGKNKGFVQQTEANTDKDNILPYGKVTGNGCFINRDGSILSSPFIINPWLNSPEQAKMVEEVIASKTIKGFTARNPVTICGETARLKWIQNEVVNNEQNFIEASASNECELTDSNTAVIQSIKKALPANATVANYSFETNSGQPMHHTDEKYYGYFALPAYNKLIKDSFYLATDTININHVLQIPLAPGLPYMDEGTAVFNNRGELIGMVEKQRIILLHHFIKQLKN